MNGVRLRAYIRQGLSRISFQLHLISEELGSGLRILRTLRCTLATGAQRLSRILNLPTSKRRRIRRHDDIYMGCNYGYAYGMRQEVEREAKSLTREGLAVYEATSIYKSCNQRWVSLPALAHLVSRKLNSELAN